MISCERDACTQTLFVGIFFLSPTLFDTTIGDQPRDFGTTRLVEQDVEAPEEFRRELDIASGSVGETMMDHESYERFEMTSKHAIDS